MLVFLKWVYAIWASFFITSVNVLFCFYANFFILCLRLLFCSVTPHISHWNLKLLCFRFLIHHLSLSFTSQWSSPRWPGLRPVFGTPLIDDLGVRHFCCRSCQLPMIYWSHYDDLWLKPGCGFIGNHTMVYLSQYAGCLESVPCFVTYDITK